MCQRWTADLAQSGFTDNSRDRHTDATDIDERVHALEQEAHMGSVSWRGLLALYCFMQSFAFTLGVRAQPDDPNAVHHFDASDASARGMLLPTLIAPASDRNDRVVANVVGGYDSALRTSVMRAIGDVNVIGPVDLRFGVTYTPDAFNGQVQPHVGMRVRILSQEKSGIDLAAALFYRLERFTADEGLVQGVLAAGRRFGPLNLLMHAAYGQDPEGDDREGEVALAGLVEASSAVQVGIENHIRFDLFSDDPKRQMRNDSEYDLTVGPLAQWSLGPLALLGQVGFRASRFQRVETGAVALAGLSGAY
jgi:hypothetical protein